MYTHKRIASIGAALALALTAGTSAHVSSLVPTHNRNWAAPQAILPVVEILGDRVQVQNVRNFRYIRDGGPDDYTAGYEDRTYELSALKNVSYVVVPFDGIPGSAHTFLSFGFANNSYLAVSVETRRETGVSYHPITGLLNKYELMYVLADERDVIGLRVFQHKDPVRVYPTVATQDQVRALFLGVVARVNGIAKQPEFYNTLTNNCTNNIAKHINHITPNRVPLQSLRMIFPEDSDKLANELGLLAITEPIDSARAKYLVNSLALAASEEDFSAEIRANWNTRD